MTNPFNPRTNLILLFFSYLQSTLTPWFTAYWSSVSYFVHVLTQFNIPCLGCPVTWNYMVEFLRQLCLPIPPNLWRP